jgi:hypothetical protein
VNESPAPDNPPPGIDTGRRILPGSMTTCWANASSKHTLTASTRCRLVRRVGSCVGARCCGERPRLASVVS